MTVDATSTVNMLNVFLVSWLPRILIAIAVFVAANYIAKYFFKIIIISFKRAKRPINAPNTVNVIIKSIFFFVAAMVVIGMFNINVWPLLTSLGVVGLIVGLALQQPLGNFFSGLMIIMTEAVNEGDALDIGGTSGTVHSTKLTHTIVDTWDGKRVYIPNTAVWSSNVTKFWPKKARRIDMAVGVPYDLSPEELVKSMEIFQRLFESEPLVYKGPLVNGGDPVSNYVTFDGYGSSSINFTLHFWTLRENYFDTQKQVGMAIFRELTKAGISIPFNQLDVHLDGSLSGFSGEPGTESEEKKI